MATTDPSQQPVIDQPSTERWRLLPREHGAYAQALFPLLTALALGSGGAAQFYWAAATIAVFVAHEPLLILAGQRGRRSHADLAERAQKLAGILLAAALIAGILGWWYAPPSARLAVALPLSLAIVLLPFIFQHREKTLPGELLASLTFSTMLIPVALAGSVTLRAALIAGAVWSTIFLLGTITVRAVIANLKKATHGRWPVYASIGLSLAAIVVSFLVFLTDAVPALAAAAVLPAAFITFACSLMGVHPRHLRTLGWSLVASNVIALAALVMALR
ncbi:MAG: YwiC-like family protein [Alphaproteobacteria bacterium]